MLGLVSAGVCLRGFVGLSRGFLENGGLVDIAGLWQGLASGGGDVRGSGGVGSTACLGRFKARPSSSSPPARRFCAVHTVPRREFCFRAGLWSAGGWATHIDPILTVDVVGEGPLSRETSSYGWATPYSEVGESEEKGRGVYRGTCLGMSSLPHRSWKQCGTGNFLVAIGGAVLSTEGCVSGLAVEVMRRVIGDQSGRLLRREV